MDAASSLPTEIPQRGCQKKWYGSCRGATRVLLFTTLISLSIVSQAGVPDEVEGACESVAWYRRAAAQGNADAQHNLGLAYEDGTGVRSLALIRTLQPTTTAGAGILTSPRHPPGSPRARG